MMSRVLNRPAIYRNYHGFSSITVMFFFLWEFPFTQHIDIDPWVAEL